MVLCVFSCRLPARPVLSCHVMLYMKWNWITFGRSLSSSSITLRSNSTTQHSTALPLRRQFLEWAVSDTIRPQFSSLPLSCRSAGEKPPIYLATTHLITESYYYEGWTTPRKLWFRKLNGKFLPTTDHRPTSHRIATYFIAAYGYFVFVSTDSGWWVVLEKSNNRQNSMEWGQRKRWVISTNLFFLIFLADEQHFIVHPESWRNHFLIMPWPGEFGKCVGNRLMIRISM